ncbi:MAG TPA: ATP-dependent metallopeptidase FtsH/Yme1/Tma family protein [Acidimicrobiales bacterium]|nr:ATP-dependent metallopeptidase FtsH/Yme1/Tma family protein [Acidimicrobiales bacterium]
MTKVPSTPPPGDKPVGSAPPPPPWWRAYLLPLGVLLTLLLLFRVPSTTPEKTELTYSDFISKVVDGEVDTAEIAVDGKTSGKLSDGTEYKTVIPTELAGEQTLKQIVDAGVDITADNKKTTSGDVIFSILLAFGPLALLVGLWIWMGKKAGSQMGGLMGIGRSTAKVFDSEKPKTRLDDVAGYDGVKREVMEIVDFLKDPGRYKRAGAMAPRGVLMTGPPGTGKTLLARAVAGEADVPFISVTGSSFVEMFVGVGAARVRDLFNEARKRAPAIIFIDEIDAIGQRRGANVAISNDEREQTLNQLLAEMDGFDSSEGIVVLAATNRPEILDPALVRPGRFDRQVVVPLPTQDDRAKILAVHCRGKKLADDVDLDVIARGTPGFSGADLANLVNEAAIRAARDRREVITAEDFDAARDRILLGRREGSNVLLPEEKRAVAYHESGHALVAAYSDNADPVHKVTILPAGQALGVTHQLPLHERHLYSEAYMYDLLAVQMGGRSAELVVFGEGSTGAANDLANATQMATRMVREFGLSPRIGPIGYPGGGPMYLQGGNEVTSKPYSDETQRAIDLEVKRILDEAESRAVNILKTHRDALDRLAERLLEEETVDGAVVYEVAGRPPPKGASQILGTAKPHPRPEPSTSAPAPAAPSGDGSTPGSD